MEKQTDRLAELFLADLALSDEVEEAGVKIREALEREAQSLTLEELLTQYGSLEKLAVLAGYREEDARRWQNGGLGEDSVSYRKELSRQLLRCSGAAALFVLAFAELLWTVYNALRGNRETLLVFLLFLLFFAAAELLLCRIGKREKAMAVARPIGQSHRLLRELSDSSIKKLLNSIALFFSAAALLVGTELGFYYFGNSKVAELEENIFSNLFLVELPLFLLLRNIFRLRLIRGRRGLPEREVCRRHICLVAGFSAVYWAGVTLLILLRGRQMQYPANTFLLAAVLFAGLILLYNLTLRRRVTRKNLVFNRRKTAAFTALALLLGAFAYLRRDTWYTQPYINSVPVVNRTHVPITYDETSGVYTLEADGDFKILHLTDIHLGNSLYSARKDLKALRACYAEIAYARPDLVIVTGDLCFPLGIMSMSLNNSAPVQQFAAFMRNTGVPWAFTYGNHDTESIASMNKQNLNEVYESLSFKTSGNLLYPYVQPEITGRNNQLIEVRNRDGSLNTALFLLDSNAYTGEGINVYDYIHDDQVDWYADEVQRLEREEGRMVSSLAFFHIPLQQYRTAYELYEAGSDEVKHFFGENGEKMIDKVCCSDYPSALFDRMLELGSTTGTFCGHDHYNNMSLEYKGIRLTYGMSIDYLAMPGIEKDTAQRGAELITLHPDSSWDVEQIPLTAIS